MEIQVEFLFQRNEIRAAHAATAVNFLANAHQVFTSPHESIQKLYEPLRTAIGDMKNAADQSPSVQIITSETPAVAQPSAQPAIVQTESAVAKPVDQPAAPVAGTSDSLAASVAELVQKAQTRMHQHLVMPDLHQDKPAGPRAAALQLLDPLRSQRVAAISDVVLKETLAALPTDVMLSLKAQNGGSNTLASGRQFVSVADMSAPRIVANHAANQLQLTGSATPLGDRLLAVGDMGAWTVPSTFAAPAPTTSRKAQLFNAKRDLETLNDELEELAATAAELTRQMEAPHAAMLALEQQQRSAAVSRLYEEAQVVEHDIHSAQEKQDLISRLVHEADKQTQSQLVVQPPASTKAANFKSDLSQAHPRPIVSTPTAHGSHFAHHVPTLSSVMETSNEGESMRLSGETSPPTSQVAATPVTQRDSTSSIGKSSSNVKLTKTLQAATKLADQLLADAANGVGFVQLYDNKQPQSTKSRYASLESTQ
jgi:hypothetical protein